MGPLRPIETRKPSAVYHPGDRIGLLELVERIPDGLAYFSHKSIESGVGWWKAICRGIDGQSCGTEVSVHTRDIRRGVRVAYSCLNCPPPPRKKRKESTRVRGAAKHHRDRIYGWFLVREWKSGTGWIVECLECSTQFHFKNSQKMILASGGHCTECTRKERVEQTRSGVA